MGEKGANPGREELASLLGEVVGLGVWEWDADVDEVRWLNDRPYEIFGIERDSKPVSAARFIQEFLTQADAESFRQKLQDALRTGASFSFQGRVRRPDGQWRWIELSGRRESLPHEASRILGAVSDITKSVLTSEANAVFGTFFEQGSYFAGVMSPDGTLLEANRVSLDACGFSREEVIGKKFWECGWWNRSPDLMEMVRRGSAEAAAGRTFQRETSYFVADGGVRMVDLMIAPVRDEDGRVIYLAPTGSDITDRKRAEARDQFLIALDDAVRPLSDPLEITLTAATLLGKHLGVDRCAYADIEADEDTMNLTGNYTRSPEIRSIVGQMTFTDFGAEVLALMRANEPYVVNDVDTHLPPVGDPAAYRATQIQAVICVPLHKRGRFVAAMAVHTITPRIWRQEEVELLQIVAARCWESIERARVERRLRELNEELERRVEERTAALVAKNAELEGFSYSISHDMRAPLRAMVSRARIVLDDEGPRLSDDGRENLERLSRAATQMAQLVDDLLAFARLGTRELTLERVDIGNLVREVAAQVQADRTECDLRLSVTCDVQVDCDPRFIGMALHNLIDNACKYRKAGEQAVVEFGCEDGCFFVRDQGIGFDMAYVSKLFVPFERLHREEYAGTGIGLANVRRAIERHQGRVWAEGEEGRGSTFYFTLG